MSDCTIVCAADVSQERSYLNDGPQIYITGAAYGIYLFLTRFVLVNG